MTSLCCEMSHLCLNSVGLSQTQTQIKKKEKNSLFFFYLTKSNLRPATFQAGHLKPLITFGFKFNDVTAYKSSEIREQWGWILVALCNQDLVMKKVICANATFFIL